MTRMHSERGQSLIEFSFFLPIMLVVVFGVVETAYALLDQHVVTKVTREGSNLISRDTTIQDAVNAMRNMELRPVNFDENSRMIFSVIKKGATTGTNNYDQHILYQRHAFGSLTGVTSTIETAGLGSFRPGPDFEANNSDTDAGLQILNMPDDVDLVRGGMLYVTELYTRHIRITPLDRFGIMMPDILYSVAYF